MRKLKDNKARVLIHLIIFLSISAVHSQIDVWPKPRNVSWPTPQSSLLSPSFRILSPRHPHLRHAVRRYLRLVLTERHRPLRPPSANLTTRSPPLKTLTLTISDLSAPLQHGVDESYSLSIPSGGSAAYLRAETAWGAMRGLETVSQLVWWEGGGRRRVARGVAVWDAPLMRHRGLLVDTARSFYGVRDLERAIEAMAMNKMNVFHWHLTDSQAFPVVVESEPELARKGAYGAEMVYTAEDVRRVVEAGLRNGVRVVPEIDTPGMGDGVF